MYKFEIIIRLSNTHHGKGLADIWPFQTAFVKGSGLIIKKLIIDDLFISMSDFSGG